jgi:hypothetical protein
MRGVLVALVLVLHGAALGAPRIALCPLQSKGASPEAMQQLDAALRIELERTKMLEIAQGAPADPVRDCTEVPRIAVFGKAQRAQEVLTGEVRAMPDSYSVTLRLIDVATEKEIGKISGSYNRDVEEMVWAARAQVARLKAPERYAGQLVIVAPAGALAKVNGTSVKPGEILVLRPGLHEVHLAAEGRTAEGWVELRYQHTLSVSLAPGQPKLASSYAAWATPDQPKFSAFIAAPKNPPEEDPLFSLVSDPSKLRPPPKPGWPKWPGIVAVVVGAGLAGGGIYEVVHAGSLRSDIDAMRDANGAVPPDKAAAAGEKLRQLDSANTAGAALLSVGGGVALGGAAYLIFAPGPSGAQVAVSGTF